MVISEDSMKNSNVVRHSRIYLNGWMLMDDEIQNIPEHPNTKYQGKSKTESGDVTPILN